MIYIVALGGGFKCPHKIYLNTQCTAVPPPPDNIFTPLNILETFVLFAYLCFSKNWNVTLCIKLGISLLHLRDFHIEAEK